MTVEPQADAGWYRVDAQTERWWDGAAWGPQIRAVAQPVQQQPTRAVTYSPAHTSHTFHLLMTVFTCGLWGLFVWLPMTIINSLRREKSVTRWR